ncbi:MAG: protocatechuate 3,4-dioxygenase subunit alpha [Beijerinckiaceae bacterium]
MPLPKLLGQTPAQTVGPFFAYSLTPEQYGYAWTSLAGPVLADETTAGERIRIEGMVYDGAGAPIADALIEIMQADTSGKYAGEGQPNARFTGFGRCGTGAGEPGHYRFETVKPGSAVPGDAPRIDIIVQMRGLLLHAFTRLYFDDELEANAADPVLALVPPERRETLVARRTAPGVYRLDIRMQGERETVFFDL